jgi:rhamnogalacturonyl hydrolase YesR
MYGFAPFATLYGQKFSDGLNINSALEQLEILYQHVHHAATGLIVHGYDASKSAPWADSKTGASPMVWGRSMAWYLIGLVDALELAENDSRTKSSPAYKRMRTILHDIARANVVAARHSATVTGSYAVWQVVDQPGAEGNYIEASASAMIAFVLAKSLRLGYISDHVIIDGSAHSPIRQGAYGPQQAQTPLPAVLTVGDVVRGLYDEVVTLFVVENDSGLLEFHGTSIIASLHEARPNFDVSAISHER